MKGLVIILFLLALAVSPAQAALRSQTAVQAVPQQYVEVSVQPTPDPVFGTAEVDIAYRAGFNTFRVIMPWTYPGQADADNDASRICSVAAEVSKLHLTLFLDVVPANAKPPVTSPQITKYTTTLGAYMSYLISRRGCAPELKGLVIQVANEANYSVFWPQATAAEDYTHLAIRTYKAVHQEAQKKGYTVPVQVMAGELAASHDPVGFMDQMHDEAQAWHFHGPFFDLFSYHCYGSGGQNLTPPDGIRTAMAADFSADQVPLLCTEYATPDPTGQQYCQLAAMAVSGRLAGYGWFRLMDDPIGDPTGLYYFDQALGKPGDSPVAKPSLRNVPAINAAAINGSVSCG